MVWHVAIGMASVVARTCLEQLGCKDKECSDRAMLVCTLVWVARAITTVLLAKVGGEGNANASACAY
eukprot:13427321-Alexandrium_andersonii.AAC.1